MERDICLARAVKRMLELKDREWGEFLLSSVFSIQSTSSSIDKIKLVSGGGNYPYITRTDRNNGVDSFICEQPSYKTDVGNCITIGLDTQTAFYQPVEFYTGQNIQILRNDKLNKTNAKFVLPLLKNLLTIFNWGSSGATLTRLRRSKILLPIRDVNTPDWEFMSDYAHEREQLQLDEYFAHANKILDDIGDINDILPLKEKEWKPFMMSSIFTLETGKGKGLNHLTQTPDGVSYLGATNRNNGVLCYVKPVEKLIQQGNGIAFIRNGEGSIGYSIYKSEPFIASSDLTIGYSNKLNRYSGAFITSIADTVRGKYNFNYKRSEKRLAKELLNLPINDLGEPDWLYMEQYAKMLTQQQLIAYLRYKGAFAAQSKA